jgi:hypothetical protein
MYGPGDWDLYEEYDGQVYYKGTPEDTEEDHMRKCEPCAQANSIMPGYMVAHGQVYKNPYKALVEEMKASYGA